MTFQSSQSAEHNHGQMQANGKVTGTIAKVSWWHQQIVDWQLQNPQGLMKDLAVQLGVSAPWLSTVKNSDAFRAYEMRRRQEHNGNVSKSIIGMVEELAKVSVEVLTERIKAERAEIGLTGVKETADMALKALGFGIPKGTGNAPGNTQVNVNIVDANSLAVARERMRQLHGPAGNGDEGVMKELGGTQLEQEPQPVLSAGT